MRAMFKDLITRDQAALGTILSTASMEVADLVADCGLERNLRHTYKKQMQRRRWYCRSNTLMPSIT